MGELQRNGIRPFEIMLTPEGIEGNISTFLESDCLILNIPPGRRDPLVGEVFPAKIQHLLAALVNSPVQYLLFVSSTSVYDGSQGPEKKKGRFRARGGPGRALTEGDRLRENLPRAVPRLRLAGLIGEDRHPGRFLAGRSAVPNPGHPVNLIHREDCIRLIYEIIRQEKWGQVFNACADKHPSRSAFYTKAAIRMGLRPPVFHSLNEGPGKFVANDKIKSELNYTFQFPDPEQMG